MKIFAMFIAVVLALYGCGDMEASLKSGSAMENSAASPEDVPVLYLTGSVQKAFAIEVNGVSFYDSEHFYTNFIDELILADGDLAERFGDAEISLEGNYGLDEFGSNSDVFAVSDTGNTYQGKTNAIGRFRMIVEGDDQDSSFQVRMVMRIGIMANKNGAVSHYCYILHGKTTVTPDEGPVLFDSFSTQLNDYGCTTAQMLEMPEGRR